MEQTIIHNGITFDIAPDLELNEYIMNAIKKFDGKEEGYYVYIDESAGLMIY